MNIIVRNTSSWNLKLHSLSHFTRHYSRREIIFPSRGGRKMCCCSPLSQKCRRGPLAKFRSKFVLEIRQLRKENPCTSHAAKTRYFQKDNAESRQKRNTLAVTKGFIGGWEGENEWRHKGNIMHGCQACAPPCINALRPDRDFTPLETWLIGYGGGSVEPRPE